MICVNMCVCAGDTSSRCGLRLDGAAFKASQGQGQSSTGSAARRSVAAGDRDMLRGSRTDVRCVSPSGGTGLLASRGSGALT